LLEVAANPEHLGAVIGFLSILHTWGQNLLHHPRVHCVVPGGGISPDQTRWIHSGPNFLVPVPVLKVVFRAKVRDGLKRLFRAGKLVFAGQLADLSAWKLFLAFLEPLYEKEWVVYAKAPFRGPDHLLQYLARYAHRVALSNRRLIAFDGESVTFRWKDYAHGNKKRKMAVSADDRFCRRVSAPVSAAHLAAGLRPHTVFWIPGGTAAFADAATRSATTPSPGGKQHPGFDSETGVFPVPGLRDPDDRRRAPFGGDGPPRRKPPGCVQRFLVAAAASWRGCNGLRLVRDTCARREAIARPCSSPAFTCLLSGSTGPGKCAKNSLRRRTPLIHPVK
jgi:hypothetical protein